ncbi:MAG: radical SAM protein, partial [Candidatus Wallbacteria bacterium]|nr:radical SAM protein [Candidatus Wallbacteria bacterium]
MPTPENRSMQRYSADFNRCPYLVIWETTRACDLACVHCRAEAQAFRNPNELTTVEAILLMEEIARFGEPVVVLTGGDPLKRPDVFGIIRHGADLGLRMTMTPSGTPLMTSAALAHAKE